MARAKMQKHEETAGRVDPVSQIQIDLSQLSFDDNMTISKLDAQVGRFGLLNERVQQYGYTSEIMDEMLQLSRPENLERVNQQIREIFARVITVIPRDWFVRGAPDALDYADPETYKWVRADKVNNLRQALAKAQSPTDTTKN